MLSFPSEWSLCGLPFAASTNCSCFCTAGEINKYIMTSKVTCGYEHRVELLGYSDQYTFKKIKQVHVVIVMTQVNHGWWKVNLHETVRAELIPRTRMSHSLSAMTKARLLK